MLGSLHYGSIPLENALEKAVEINSPRIRVWGYSQEFSLYSFFRAVVCVTVCACTGGVSKIFHQYQFSVLSAVMLESQIIYI